MDQIKIPTLKCYATGKGQVKAWCPFCNAWHIHGHPGAVKAGKIGHWVDHCTDSDSPFKKTGYNLMLMSKAEVKAIAGSLNHYETKKRV